MCCTRVCGCVVTNVGMSKVRVCYGDVCVVLFVCLGYYVLVMGTDL